MKKSLISILALLLMASCQMTELVPEYMPADDELYASIESLESTKTVMDENNNVLWSEEDQLVAFMGTTLGIKYQIKEQYVGTSTGGFSKIEEPGNEDDLESGQEIDHNVVLYPHSTSVWCMKNDSNNPTQSYKLNVVLPETQVYEENSFGIGSFPMIAVSTDNKLTFRNICGGLKLQFKGVAKIKSIKLEGLGGEKISGKSTVVGYVNGSAPTIAMANSNKSYTHVTLDCGEGVQLSKSTPTTFIIAVPPVEFSSGMKITVTDTDGLSKTLTNSSSNTIKRSCLIRFPVITYEPSTPAPEPVPEAVDLSAEGTANSYIVSQQGAYKFSTVKGNSSESVGAVASAEVLWESFGTDVTPNVGDLVKNISYKNGEVTFQTADTFKEGNAVIAAKDASGNILWSWHIWLTDEPQGQVYYNNAGTMMDRNLGATSATPGDVGALGLLYQWGRKDPFLGSSSISSSNLAKSTITWPSAVESSSSNGTIEYATANPTTFITSNSDNIDWYYTSNSSTDNTRWTESDKSKSIYDPCPHGWRVPDGGADGIWSTALDSWFSFTDSILYDGTNEGMNFSGKFGSASTIWYPASGYRYYDGGGLSSVGGFGDFWSASPTSNGGSYAYTQGFSSNGFVRPSGSGSRAGGYSVRCVREGTTPSTPAPEPVPEAVDLSAEGTANSYIVSQKGAYKFSTVKGNSSESVGAVASAEVLWETFGTDVTPKVGDLVKNVVYSDGYIAFQTADTFKEGNAVIAAKDASGNILWSWHIWLTDEPQGQEYYNNAGTMMDCNLGATSATPGDVGALGLLYQWGRKDPFLGSSSISSSNLAKSTITWPSAVESSSSNGTIEYATTNPTTFIRRNSNNSDWYYTSNYSTDNTRWTESDKSKSIYDPCPAGWRVPDGGDYGIWSSTLGSSSHFKDDLLYDSTNEGMNFSGKFGSASTIWYPALGCRSDSGGGLFNVGSVGAYWSASPFDNYAYCLEFSYNGHVTPSYSNSRASGYSVRCVREGTTPSTPADPEAVDLSADGTANSYIVSQKGSYKFSTVKGNSSESVGAVASADVLWETFGTDETPNVGDLVKNAVYSDGYITFQTADTFKEGNAVIAAKDASGTILWSWHVWLTDEPQGQEYYNNAGTMMDRNLGATSATPGDVGALGLLYQWGRKDPFLGSSSISSDAVAKSTITWPSAVESSSSNGTIEYATANPTTFIKYNGNNNDWYYTGLSSTDNTRWTTSESSKSIYDPCPAGWRVPDGGSTGVWSKAIGSSSSFEYTYDGTNEGMNFSGKFGSEQTIWYPASGFRDEFDGSLNLVGYYGFCWSAFPSVYGAYYMSFNYDGSVYPSYNSNRARGYSVRCLQE